MVTRFYIDAHRSVVVDNLRDSVAFSESPDSDNLVGIFYIYCDYLMQHLQTPVNALGSLLRQFHEEWPEKLEEIMQMRGVETSDTFLTSELAVVLLGAVFGTFEMVYICIDGMDTWDRPSVRDFLQSLYEALCEFPGRWRIFSSFSEYHRDGDLRDCLERQTKAVDNWRHCKDDRAKCIKYWIEKYGNSSEINERFIEESVSYLREQLDHQGCVNR